MGMRAALPADEAERLRAVRDLDVLDTAAEPDYDDIAGMAAHVCEVPMSLVSLIDADRQWIKAKVGVDRTEVDRDVSFCAHAILGRDLLVVSDARSDARFAGNPAVLAEPGVRFYAGAPLVTSAGHAVGTLCVVDTEPRRLTVEQLRALRALARQVSRQLDLRQYAATATRLTEQVWELERRTDEVADLAGGELHTPLAQLRRLLQHSAGVPADPQALAALLDVADRYAQPLRQLLDDLLGIAESTARDQLRMRTFDLAELTRGAVESVRPVGYVKRVPIIYYGGQMLPVYADPIRLDQALTHVLFNAVKYTPPGGRLEVTTAAEVGPAVRIRDPDLLGGARSSLYRHFYDGALAHPHDVPGSDRGLAAVKQIFDVHHATVTLCDEPGEGTALSVVFPHS
jgi:GAF domain-containing protein